MCTAPRRGTADSITIHNAACIGVSRQSVPDIVDHILGLSTLNTPHLEHITYCFYKLSYKLLTSKLNC